MYCIRVIDIKLSQHTYYLVLVLYPGASYSVEIFLGELGAGLLVTRVGFLCCLGPTSSSNYQLKIHTPSGLG